MSLDYIGRMKLWVHVFWKNNGKLLDRQWNLIPSAFQFPPAGLIPGFCLRKVKGSGGTAHGAALGNSENNIQMTYGKTEWYSKEQVLISDQKRDRKKTKRRKQPEVGAYGSVNHQRRRGRSA